MKSRSSFTRKKALERKLRQERTRVTGSIYASMEAPRVTPMEAPSGVLPNLPKLEIMVAEELPIAVEMAEQQWHDEDTRSLILWRTANASLFTGRRHAAVNGYEMYIASRGLEGRVTPTFLKKKWENLKHQYKAHKYSKPGVSMDGSETPATSWKWYNLMDEAIGGRLSMTPPIFIASCSQDSMAGEAASMPTPERYEAAGSVPKRRRVDLGDVLKETMDKDERFELELREMEARAIEREEARAREAAEREERRHREAVEREETRHREAVEREERRHRDAVEREERFFREMRERDDRRDSAAREERFLAILEALIQK
ncbi:uncharacterized protein LOC133635972 isoform X2 [Entelurus aequoreus]|uniref:uncharacterized protein LOC133635972 isoform X2 n=1 Tax=Entelurus aequoreus TaxID=161455 RepID=UPI002B1D945A|nr:uncharacterized protein LOC133635972 isoform X2 [Entelurus aequoreus]